MLGYSDSLNWSWVVHGRCLVTLGESGRHCQRCCCAPLDRECPRSCLPCNICSLQLAQLHAQQSPAARCLHFAALTLLLALTMTLTLTNLVDTDIDNYIVINDIDTLHVQCWETVIFNWPWVVHGRRLVTLGHIVRGVVVRH